MAVVRLHVYAQTLFQPVRYTEYFCCIFNPFSTSSVFSSSFLPVCDVQIRQNFTLYMSPLFFFFPWCNSLSLWHSYLEYTLLHMWNIFGWYLNMNPVTPEVWLVLVYLGVFHLRGSTICVLWMENMKRFWYLSQLKLNLSVCMCTEGGLLFPCYFHTSHCIKVPLHSPFWEWNDYRISVWNVSAHPHAHTSMQIYTLSHTLHFTITKTETLLYVTSYIHSLYCVLPRLRSAMAWWINVYLQECACFCSWCLLNSFC